MTIQTISFTPLATSSFTLNQLNVLFASIAMVLNNKLDARGGILTTDLLIHAGGIINVPIPKVTGDLIGVLGMGSVENSGSFTEFEVPSGVIGLAGIHYDVT